MLYEKINEELKVAMKAGDEFKTGLFRMISAAIHNKEIENKGKGKDEKLTDDEIIEVLTREAKKRKEAGDIFIKGGRTDLAGKEMAEFEVVKQYLPEQLGEAEIEKIVLEAVKKTGASDQKNFGKVMAEAMKELKGKADASLVSRILKSKLE